MQKESEQICMIKQGTKLYIRGRLGSGTSGKWCECVAMSDFDINSIQRLPLLKKEENGYYEFYPLTERVKVKIILDGKEVIVKDGFD